MAHVGRLAYAGAERLIRSFGGAGWLIVAGSTDIIPIKVRPKLMKPNITSAVIVRLPDKKSAIAANSITAHIVQYTRTIMSFSCLVWIDALSLHKPSLPYLQRVCQSQNADFTGLVIVEAVKNSTAQIPLAKFSAIEQL